MSQVHPAEWLILLLAVLALMVLIALATAGIAIVIALRKERPGTALAIVGATLLGLMALPVAGWLLFVHRASADFGGIPSVVPMSPSGPIANGARLAARGWQFTEHDAIHAVTSWKWVTLLLIGFIFAAVVRRLMIPRTTRTRRRWSPAVLVVLLFAVVLGSIRHQTARSYHATPQPARQNAAEMVAQQQALLAQQHTTAKMAQHLAQAQVDIHEQMDEFDAPRIPLPPMPPSTPASIAAPAAAIAAVAQNAVAAKPVENAPVAAKPAAKSANKERLKPAEPANNAPKATRSLAKSKPSGLKEKPAEKEAASSIGVANQAQSATSPPSWVDASPKRVGQSWRQVIVTDEYSTPDECYRATDQLLSRAVLDYLPSVSGYGSDSNALRDSDPNIRAANLQQIGFSANELRRAIVKDEYMVTSQHSFGPMKKLYTLVEFSPAFDHELEQRWDAYHRQSRLAVVGLGAGSIVGLLALAFALLKIDTLTKGYYSKRLFIGVPAAIIGGLLLLSFVFR